MTFNEIVRLDRANAWLKEPGFAALYVRIGDRYLEGRSVRMIQLASFAVKNKGRGVFTRFAARIESCQLPIFVESVINDRFAKYLPKLGFVEVAGTTPPCFVKQSHIKGDPMKIKPRELMNMGWEEGPCIGEATRCVARANDAGMSKSDGQQILASMLDDHEPYMNHPHFGSLAQLVDIITKPPYIFRDETDARAAYQVWGAENIDENTHDQMNRALQIPVAVRGALMPDAHLGYGLPIGGVLAVDDAVVPYAVGVDIACRMMLSVIPIDVPEEHLGDDPIEKHETAITKAIAKHTRFGLGAAFNRSGRRKHEVMDRDWSILDGIVDKDVAWNQLGSSGGGNHFVDIGVITFKEAFGSVSPGSYVSILTHSGSRGMGLKIANYYTRVAESKHPLLPSQYKKLAWLSLGDEAGAAYWEAMQLAGAYASANHNLIHHHLLKELGWEALLQVENHHNYAWKEEHDGKTVIVHRKGATPAGSEVLGIIPGSMATPGFLVRGKANVESLSSASHGAGRAMSRKEAKNTHCWDSVREQLKHRNVKLISGGLDEVPGSYKDIWQVMEAQSDLVEVLAQFDPRLVKMAEE